MCIKWRKPNLHFVSFPKRKCPLEGNESTFISLLSRFFFLKDGHLHLSGEHFHIAEVLTFPNWVVSIERKCYHCGWTFSHFRVSNFGIVFLGKICFSQFFEGHKFGLRVFVLGFSPLFVQWEYLREKWTIPFFNYLFFPGWPQMKPSRNLFKKTLGWDVWKLIDCRKKFFVRPPLQNLIDANRSKSETLFVLYQSCYWRNLELPMILAKVWKKWRVRVRVERILVRNDHKKMTYK